MPVLTTKIRKLIEKHVATGVPPVTAGLAMGLSPKTVSAWVQTGMAHLDTPVRVTGNPDENVDCGPLGFMTNAEYAAHMRECAALARTSMMADGKLVSALVKRMWKNSKNNPGMMMFMFKQYQDAHGKAEAAPARAKEAGAEGATPVDEERVTIVLPDNGRKLQ